jgi:hypothetical protein
VGASVKAASIAGAVAFAGGVALGWRREAREIRTTRVDVVNMLGRSPFPQGSLLIDIVATVKRPLRHVASALAGLIVDGEVESDRRQPARYRLVASRP